MRGGADPGARGLTKSLAKNAMKVTRRGRSNSVSPRGSPTPCTQATGGEGKGGGSLTVVVVYEHIVLVYDARSSTTVTFKANPPHGRVHSQPHTVSCKVGPRRAMLYDAVFKPKGGHILSYAYTLRLLRR